MKHTFTSFDENYRDSLFGDKKELFVNCSKDFIKDSYIVKLSDKEAFIISGEEDVEKSSKKIIELGCKFLIITLGKK